jgi:D-beta-D-heptose 7-phosphate kinase / D-beta-D-heptose 1-phosphate adenosyltransferase
VAVSRRLTDVLTRFDGLSVLVIGEAMLDAYLVGKSDRLCQEAPVPIVSVLGRTEAPGGAANVAMNAAALGARVTLLSVVGPDAEGELVRATLAGRGVAVDEVVIDPGRRTLAKHRLFAGTQLLVRFDHGTTDAVGAGAERRLASALEGLHAQHDVVVVSDYGYGVLTPRVIAALADAQARAARVLVADSKTLGAYRTVGVTAVKPNYDEALRLLGGPRHPRRDERIAFVARRGRRLLDVTGAQIAAVTLDTEGALFFERGRPPYRTYARPVEHSRAAGAGDTFAGALALALGAGADLAGAAEIASAAAGLVVQKEGTATCTTMELAGALAPGDRYCRDRDELARRLALYRRQGRRVVLTNGCFDILHRGHIAYLNEAKSLGDVLVVGVNSDRSVRRLKGPERPINGLEDRVEVLAALSCIDHVVAFEEDTPVDLIGRLRPDVFVKGGDYTADMLPEAPVVEALGGVVRILPYVRDRSTTSIIARLRAAGGDPLRKTA